MSRRAGSSRYRATRGDVRRESDVLLVLELGAVGRLARLAVVAPSARWAGRLGAAGRREAGASFDLVRGDRSPSPS